MVAPDVAFAATQPHGARMATCPECEYEEIDTEDFEEGDTLSCPECGRDRGCLPTASSTLATKTVKTSTTTKEKRSPKRTETRTKTKRNKKEKRKSNKEPPPLEEP